MSLKNLVKKIFYLNIHTEHLYHLIILKIFPSRVLNYSNFREDVRPVPPSICKLESASTIELLSLNVDTLIVRDSPPVIVST